MKIKKVSRIIPFGYKQSEDINYLDEIPSELEALDQAKKYLETCSYREVAEWLHRKTNRYISHVGLRKRIQRNITTETKKDSQDEGEKFGQRDIKTV
tara:strand:+ start:807 stop:1097 length:291 start_codon:yes stop_codon:yes gene_type:complete